MSELFTECKYENASLICLAAISNSVLFVLDPIDTFPPPMVVSTSAQNGATTKNPLIFGNELDAYEDDFSSP